MRIAKSPQLSNPAKGAGVDSPGRGFNGQHSFDDGSGIDGDGALDGIDGFAGAKGADGIGDPNSNNGARGPGKGAGQNGLAGVPGYDGVDGFDGPDAAQSSSSTFQADGGRAAANDDEYAEGPIFGRPWGGAPLPDALANPAASKAADMDSDRVGGGLAALTEGKAVHELLERLQAGLQDPAKNPETDTEEATGQPGLGE